MVCSDSGAIWDQIMGDNDVALVRAVVRSSITGLAYLIVPLCFGVGFWRGLAVAAIALVMIAANYGRQWIERGAVILIVLGLLSWLDLFPQLQEWRQLFAQAASQVHVGTPKDASRVETSQTQVNVAPRERALANVAP
jgi:hypothetical protein